MKWNLGPWQGWFMTERTQAQAGALFGANVMLLIYFTVRGDPPMAALMMIGVIVNGDRAFGR